jgi:hypothetical protein
MDHRAPPRLIPYAPTAGPGTGRVEWGQGRSARVRPKRCRHTPGHVAEPPGTARAAPVACVRGRGGSPTGAPAPGPGGGARLYPCAAVGPAPLARPATGPRPRCQHPGRPLPGVGRRCVMIGLPKKPTPERPCPPPRGDKVWPTRLEFFQTRPWCLALSSPGRGRGCGVLGNAPIHPSP